MPDATSIPGSDTREALLDAAEELFAEHGVTGASLRAITGTAGANLAAVHYHFGSKEGLVRVLLEDRLAPLHRARLERLDACLAAADPPSVECLVRAFITPVIRMMREGRRFGRMVGRIFHEPSEETRTLLLEEFRGTVESFTGALSRALPELSRQELFWRFHFMVGCLAHTAALAHEVAPHFAGDACDPDDAETLIAQMTAFLTAGWQAPPAGDGDEDREDPP